MRMRTLLLSGIAALAMGVAGCSQGSTIASPGATNPGTGGGGGGGGGGAGGGGGTAICPTGTANMGAIGLGGTICQIAGEILTNLSLPATPNVYYRIAGRVDIGKDVGATGTATGGQAATLTIAPGATLYGAAAADMLIVNRGSRMVANGTVSQPIIFTSDKDVRGENDPSVSSRQWGGVFLLGRAAIRGCNTAVAPGSAACQAEAEGVTASTGRPALYGGATDTDDSGSLQFVQIRYPGAFFNGVSGDDLNGLTLAGVGSGTVIDRLQIHNSGDDGIEIFGGKVSMKRVVLTGELDDSLDCDSGWTGNVQFLVVKQTALSGGPDGLIECSNINANSVGGTLQTRPTISNFTLVGLPTTQPSGGLLKGIGLDASVSGPTGASGRFYNGVVVGSTRCMSVVDPETGSGRGSADTVVPPTFNSVLFDCVNQPTTVAAGLIAAGSNNSTTTTNTLVSSVFPGSAEIARTAVNPTTLGAFFEAANYIGAFSGTETPVTNWAAGWTIQLLPVAGCPVGTTDLGSLLNGRKRCVLSGTIGANGVPASVRLTAGNYYEISGRVDIGVDRGAAGTAGTAATLTIDPGVTMYGNDSADILIVNRGSQILVNGTAVAPVIMTSDLDLLGRTKASPSTFSREWGGLILAGRAKIKACNVAATPGDAACQAEVEGVTASTGRPALYGGATDTDSSGRLNYLQIRYPGAFFNGVAGDDLNGLTLAGVGSGTLIDNVQIHNSGDDGVEIFGGTVSMKHLIITGALDDSLDCDSGWTGKVQFLVVRQTGSTGAPDGLVECSNINGNSNVATTIQTRPTISNFTMIAVASKGIGLDASVSDLGASGRFYNGVVSYIGAVATSRCLSVAVPETGSGRGSAEAGADRPTFNSILFDCPTTSTTVIPTTTVSAATLIAEGTNNSTGTADTLGAALAPSTVVASFVNGANETARTFVASTTLNTLVGGTFFTAAPYIGAVKDTSDNWWRSWTCGLETASC